MTRSALVTGRNRGIAPATAPASAGRFGASRAGLVNAGNFIRGARKDHRNAPNATTSALASAGSASGRRTTANPSSTSVSASCPPTNRPRHAAVSCRLPTAPVAARRSRVSSGSAAASATAVVSEPPRPSVAMRFPGAIPWKPATTATSPLIMRPFNSSTSMPTMRAARCAESVRSGICQPCQDRALTPIDCSTSASRPDVTCSPEETTASYSRVS